MLFRNPEERKDLRQAWKSSNRTSENNGTEVIKVLDEVNELFHVGIVVPIPLPRAHLPHDIQGHHSEKR